MNRMSLILAGFGRVGRAFFRLVSEKSDDCRERYGVELTFMAVLRRNGGYIAPEGLTSDDVFDGDRPAPVPGGKWMSGLNLEDLLNGKQKGCFVECTPTDLSTGGPALDYCRKALRSGWHVAAAGKGALVVAYRELRELAEASGAALKYSGAAAAALPTLDVGRIALAGARVEAVEGILTGTTNYILTRMGDGLDFEAALQEAGEKGIAEPDPSLDIDGWDTSAKLVLISNAVMETDFSIKDVRIHGIRRVEPTDIAAARKEGRDLKLIGSCKPFPGERGFHLRTSVRALDSSHPLYVVRGTEKGIVFHTDTMGSVIVTGGRSNPRGTAAALLKDILNIHRGIL